jgi:hypothetical protein
MLCTRRETLGQWLAPAPLSSSQLGSFANQLHLCMSTNWQVTWMETKNKCQNKSILPSECRPSHLDRRVLQMVGDSYADVGDVVVTRKVKWCCHNE